MNNYTDLDIDFLSTCVENGKCVYLIFGKEVGESNTPHLQGFISFKKRVYLTELKKRISSTAHFEIARRNLEAVEYCKKDGDFYEFGEPSIKGKRTDLEDFKADVAEGMINLKTIREKHSSVYARYKSFVLEYVQDHSPSKIVCEHELHDWQTELMTKLDGPADDRTIQFLVDLSGNNGKTW
ncbi:MAG: hypothetical protein ACRDL7_12780, partial [Gaiellaceae bacterium]